jgi:hypothetical protein
MANKEIREITHKLIEQGWRIEEAKRGGHAKAFSPDGQTIVALPSTPGGGRWKQNLIAQLRRGGFDPDA